MNTILVSSHRRSGTHFLIDSIRANASDTIFPNHRELPVDFNLGSLFSKDEKIFNRFKKLISEHNNVIIKSHLLPEECNIENPKDKFEEYIKEIYLQSKKIYIHRDGKDTIVSLYKFLNPSISFSQFIREKNDHIVNKIRDEKGFDANRISYLSYHIEQWKEQESVKCITFSNLLSQFEDTMIDLFNFLECPVPNHLKKPQIPKNKLWHGIRKKMNHYGFMTLPSSSAVKPNRRQKRFGKQLFQNESVIQFYNENIKRFSID